VSRRALRLFIAAVVAALVVPVAAGASLSLRGIDTSSYPTVRVTVVAPVAATAAPPTLTENGNAVVGLQATNLASTKSVVVAIDRSRSMAGAKLADALDAARAFLHTKSPTDRVSVVAFGFAARLALAGAAVSVASPLAIGANQVEQDLPAILPRRIAEPLRVRR